MNERIKDLYEQARLHAKTINADRNPQEWMDEYHKKFAELIVKDCVDLLMKPEYAMNNPTLLSPYNEGWANGRLLGIEHIKEHFGVE